MKAAIFHEHGGPDRVVIEEVPRPSPAAGEVLIRVRAAALNHLDLWVRRGIGIPTTMPHIGGSDFAGVVEEVGAQVTGPEPGTSVLVNPVLSCGSCRDCVAGEEPLCVSFRIIGEHTDGGFAEFVSVPAANLHPLPDGMSFETAATLPISYQTAWRALISRAALRAGEDVLVIGASGGTASAAIEVAKLAGARVFAVTSGAENVRRAHDLGADVVFDRNEVDFSREVYRETGKRGVDVVVENVGAATWDASVRALARGGRLVTYGATSGHEATLDLRLLFWKQLRLIGSTMANRAEFAAMLRAAARGAFRPAIDRILPLERAREAHERLEAGQQFGKILLVP
jgi:NADPH:quinone reductase-like Zn-dependent oxidoreductase